VTPRGSCVVVAAAWLAEAYCAVAGAAWPAPAAADQDGGGQLAAAETGSADAVHGMP
jgi:hypothetical protein